MFANLRGAGNHDIIDLFRFEIVALADLLIRDALTPLALAELHIRHAETLQELAETHFRFAETLQESEVRN